MRSKFAGFSFERHQMTGQRIYHAREFFIRLQVDLAKSYGETAKPVRLAENIVETIDRLRNSLDEVVCIENPEREDWELNRCYFSVVE